MTQISAREVRRRLAELLDSAQAGQTIEITRHGKAVARITPPPRQPVPRKLPDMAGFRRSLKMSGKPLSRIVTEQRRGARY
jgi:prevent-host-death family protein